jgi:hypothetical protein
MNKIVSVIGAGLIGKSWAISFARGGNAVRLFDASDTVLRHVLRDLISMLQSLEHEGLLKGASADQLISHISIVSSLSEALDGALHVQENAPETLEAKTCLFAELDELADPLCTLASSTSALLPSAFSSGLRGRDRVLVAHPLNPPHLVPAVEIVPAAWTSQRAVDAVADLMVSCGQVPIKMSRELPGFVMNRLQGALLHEAFRLVEGQYASVEGVDAAVKHGLGMRWAFMGPFETIDLNAPNGVADFIKRYGAAYREIASSQTVSVDWSGQVADVVAGARRAVLPSEQLGARQVWRDAELARLAQFKNCEAIFHSEPQQGFNE